MKRFLSFVAAVLTLTAALAFTSCSNVGEDIFESSVEITLNGDRAACNSNTVYVQNDDMITITSAGTYIIKGTLNEGQILVDCIDAGKVRLVLYGANITNKDGACIHIKKAQEAEITLYEGTENVLTDGKKYVFPDSKTDEPDGVIFSKEDLVINGGGSLTVNANYANGIVSKDGLTIDSGKFNIISANNAIKGKDYLVINGGEYTIYAYGDGLKATNIENTLNGYVDINGGNLNIYSEDEAIQAVTAVRFNGGNTKITAIKNGIRCVGAVEFNGGEVILDADSVAIDAVKTVKLAECKAVVNGKNLANTETAE